MPTYSYRCPKCANKFDKILPLSKYKTPQVCDECGYIAQKVMTIGAVRREKPVWLDNSIRNQIQDLECERPIETRAEYENYLRDNGFVPTN